jgi:hypothetical protein
VLADVSSDDILLEPEPDLLDLLGVDGEVADGLRSVAVAPELGPVQ